MKWLLLIWIASNDSYFPDPHQALVLGHFDTREACVKEGPTARAEGFYHVTAWACVEGNETESDKKK
jgi:hypothetical protein